MGICVRVGGLFGGAALLAVIGALAFGPSPASAESAFGCLEYKCAGVSGPVEYPINHVEGENIYANGVCASVFESAGPRRGFECEPYGKFVGAGNDCLPFGGYATVARYYKEYLYYFAGRQYLQEPVCTVASASTTLTSPTRPEVRASTVAEFGVFAHPEAGTSARPYIAGSMVPTDAVLALELGERRVWMWELPSGQAASVLSPEAAETAAAFENKFSSSPEAAARAAKFVSELAEPAQKPELCIASETPGVGGVPVDGHSCKPISTVLREGSVSFSGAGGPSFPVTIRVVVPNGVKTIEITEADGRSRSVQVENNVALAVVRGGENALPPQPATTVSYQMPDGSVQNTMAPAH